MNAFLRQLGSFSVMVHNVSNFLFPIKETAPIGRLRKFISALLISSAVVTEPHNLKCFPRSDSVRSMS